jgi:(hydroxyamino)benzene mutase
VDAGSFDSEVEAVMNGSHTLSRAGHRLLQIGVALFLFTSFEGFAVPYFAVPNLGRSVHTLSGFTGVLFVALGLAWTRLDLGTTASRVAFWFLVYSAFATIAGFVIAGFLGAGGSIMPLAAGGARGSDFQEALIQSWSRKSAQDDKWNFCLTAGTLCAANQERQ